MSGHGNAKLENRRAMINTLADRVCDFYENYEGDTTPTAVIHESELKIGKSGKLDLLEDLGKAIGWRNVSHRYSPRPRRCADVMYGVQIIAENVLETPVYKLKIDIVDRPEGGHHQ